MIDGRRFVWTSGGGDLPISCIVIKYPRLHQDGAESKMHLAVLRVWYIDLLFFIVPPLRGRASVNCALAGARSTKLVNLKPPYRL